MTANNFSQSPVLINPIFLASPIVTRSAIPILVALRTPKTMLMTIVLSNYHENHIPILLAE